MNEMFFSDKRNAIAADRCVSRITSSEFVKRHHLKSASAVQSATKRLLDLDLITEQHKFYSISDPTFKNLDSPLSAITYTHLPDPFTTIPPSDLCLSGDSNYTQ
jgi:hypothetical protein